jgi:hypothetical protein
MIQFNTLLLLTEGMSPHYFGRNLHDNLVSKLMKDVEGI